MEMPKDAHPDLYVNDKGHIVSRAIMRSARDWDVKGVVIGEVPIKEELPKEMARPSDNFALGERAFVLVGVVTSSEHDPEAHEHNIRRSYEVVPILYENREYAPRFTVTDMDLYKQADPRIGEGHRDVF